MLLNISEFHEKSHVEGWTFLTDISEIYIYTCTMKQYDSVKVTPWKNLCAVSELSIHSLLIALISTMQY
jgi:hypothetical protein